MDRTLMISDDVSFDMVVFYEELVIIKVFHHMTPHEREPISCLTKSFKGDGHNNLQTF